MSGRRPLTARWYDRRGRRPILLRPLGWLYRGVVALRRGLYRHRWLRSVRVSVPVIVVGNITVGGTGKTPLAVRLTRELQQAGWQPGIVSRGYGGSQSEATLLPAMPDPVRFGDEPCLLRRETRAPVAVGRDRPVAAECLVAAGVDVIIADDGLQHYRLQRDIEICVLDGERRLGNGLLLPCGPLREPVSRLQQVAFRVVNGGEAEPGETRMALHGDQARSLSDPPQQRALTDFCGRHVHAIAGIGNPERFFSSLREQGLTVTAHPFADHHRFARRDLDFGDELPVLMTAKDAVKCSDLGLSDAWYVPVEAALPAAFFDALHARLRQVAVPRPATGG